MTAVLVADPVREYAERVVTGAIVANNYVRLACQRHLDDLEHGADRGLVWNAEEAQRVIDVIEQFRLPTGQPFRLEPPQVFIVGSLFGWYRTDGSRRFRTAYIEMGKGNGKTPMAGAIGIVAMAADGHRAAEVYTAGVTRDQAQYLWTDGRRIVEASDTLRGLIDVGAHNLAMPSTDSYMRPVSSEARSLDQKRVHCALIDEIHEHATDLVVEKMRAGTKGDDSALIVEITNSGYDRNSVCWRHHEYSIAVVQGAVENDSWFAYVCGLDEGDDYADEAVWPKANPLLGITVTPRYLREQVQEARDMPAKAALVKRLNFCVWTEASAGAIELGRWDTGSAQPVIADGATVYGGLDISSTMEIASLVLVHEASDGGLDVLCRFWCPEAVVEQRSRRDRVPYDVWVNSGHLVMTPGDVIDYDRILADLTELAGRYNIAELGYLRLNATGFITAATGLTTLVPVTQSFTGFSAGTKDWLARVAGSTLDAPRLRHGGHPVLRWMAANLVVDTSPNGDLKPSLEHSSERIGGQVAAIMAVSRLTAPHEPAPTEPGIFALYRDMVAQRPATTT